MANRTMGGGQVNGASALGTGLSGATIGPKLTYTCPPGTQAEVTFASVRLTVGAPSTGLLVTIGGVTVLVVASGASFTVSVSIMLGPGDTAQLTVTSQVGASTFDGLISVREFLAA